MHQSVALLLLGGGCLAAAQQSAYGQCGGASWTGATACVSGYTCAKQNDYYSQCIPGTAGTTPAAGTTSAGTTLTTKTSTTTTTRGSTSTSGSSSSSSGVKYMFAFGDSYTATGFQAGNTLPSASNPMGNPVPPARLWTDSYNWAEYLTLDYSTGTLLTLDFAVGGVCVDLDIVQNCGGGRSHMDDQIETLFLGSGGASAKVAWTGGNSLFAMWIGINDIWDMETLGSNYTALDTSIMTRYFALMEELYGAGARNFLFVNVPEIQKTPRTAALSSSVQSAEAAMVSDYNSKLAAKISAFKSAHSDVKTFSYDSYSTSAKVIASPGLAGYSTASGSASTSVWYDDYHFRTGVHKIFAQEIAALLTSGGFW